MVNEGLESQRLQSTHYGRILLILSCILFVDAYLFTNLIPAFSATAIILYLTYAKLNLKNTIKNLDIDIERTILEKMRFANKPFNIVLRIKNDSSIAHLEIEDKIPKGCSLHKGTNKYSTLISPKKEYKIRYSIYASERGLYTFEGLRVTIKDKSKLFQYTLDWTLISNIRAHSNLDMVKKARTMAKREKLEMTVKARDKATRLGSYEFDGIRDYLPGDRLKDIEWKATSKLSKLMTKIFENKMQIPSIILLDCSKSMRKATGDQSKIDHGIQLSLQLSEIFQAWKHPIGLIAFDEYKVLSYIKPSESRRQFDGIFNTLLHIPNRILVNEYSTGLSTESLPDKNEPSDQFISKIAPFLTKRKRRYKSITQTAGIYEAIRTLTSTTEGSQFILLITDLETNLHSLYEALKLGTKYNHKIVVITPFSYWYDSNLLVLKPDRLEIIYSKYTEKQKIIKKLREFGVKVIEITPQDVGQKVIVELERKTK